MNFGSCLRRPCAVFWRDIPVRQLLSAVVLEGHQVIAVAQRHPQLFWLSNNTTRAYHEDIHPQQLSTVQNSPKFGSRQTTERASLIHVERRYNVSIASGLSATPSPKTDKQVQASTPYRCCVRVPLKNMDFCQPIIYSRCQILSVP